MGTERPYMLRYWRRAILIAWFCICMLVAFESAAEMFVDFAPQHTETMQSRRVESESIEYVRRFWSGSMFVLSGMLVATAGALLVVGWRASYGQR